MLDFFLDYQNSIMLFLSGACTILGILTLFSKALPPRRRALITIFEFSAALLLIADRFCYMFDGVPGPTAFWVVRIGNFLVFFLELFLAFLHNLYLGDQLRAEKTANIRVRLYINEILFVIGTILIIVSQFTGLYYTFDENNLYSRGPAFLVCMVVPFFIMLLQLTIIIQNRAKLKKRLYFSMLLFIIIPYAAAVVQILFYGSSLINIAMGCAAVLLYLLALLDLNESLEEAKAREIAILREQRKRLNTMFEQTAEALASAIDAKDEYTRGHSSRVADYAEMLAKEAGLSEDECQEVFFAGLLHDVGKIGVRDDIINKKGKLTPEEYEEMKRHPAIGQQILSTISESPYLNIGAHYHHERYAGGGYPEGLGGEEIPEVARILAVADAYDAMTSRRSYRDTMPQEKVREEIEKGAGTQFDPKYASIMLRFIDADTGYQLREGGPEIIHDFPGSAT